MAVQYNSKNDTWGGFGVDIAKSIKDKVTGNLDISDDIKKNLETLKDLQGATGAASDLKSLFSDVDEDFSKFLDDVDMSGDVFKQYQAHMKANQESTSLFSRGLKGAGTALKTIGATLGSMAAMWAIGEVISLAIKGFDNLAHASERAKEAMEEAKSTISDAQKELQNVSSTINDNKSRFLELSNGVSSTSKNLKLSKDDYEEYLSISNKIAEIAPNLVLGYDEQGNALLKIGKNSEETSKLLDDLIEKQQIVANQAIIDNIDKVAKGVSTTIAKSKNKISELKSEMNSVMENTSSINLFDEWKNNGGITLDNDNLLKHEKDIKNALKQANINFTQDDKQVMNGKFISFSGFTEAQIQQAQKVYDELLSIEKNNFDAYKNDLSKQVSEQEGIIDQYYSEMTSSLTTWTQNNYKYTYLGNFGEEYQQMIDQSIQNIDWSEVFGDNAPDSSEPYEQWIEKNLLDPLMSVPEKYQGEIKNSFQKLLSFEDGDLNILPFAEALQKRLDELHIKINLTPIISNEKEAKQKLENDIKSSSTKKDMYGRDVVDNSEYKKLTDYTKDFTAEQIEQWLKVTSVIEGAENKIDSYEESMSNAEKKNSSFSSVFNSDDFKSTKEKLLELAKAGELTPYTLSSTKEYKTLLDQTGVSAEKAYKKIMKITQKDMDETDWNNTLSNSRSQVVEIKNAKKELNKNGESADFVSTIIEKFPQLIEYLGNEKGMLEQLNALQQDQENIANNAYLHMVEDSEVYYSTLKKKEAEKLKTTNSTVNAIIKGNASLVSVLGKYYKVDLNNYKSIADAKAKLEKTLITNSAKAWSKFYRVQVNAQTGLAEVYNNSTTVPSEYLKKAGGDYGKAVSMMTKEQNKQKNAALATTKAYNEAIKGLDSVIKDPEITSPSATSTSKTKKAKTTYQVFSQTIDWCAQTLKKLSAQIDNVQAKLNNTSSLSKQISYYKKLVKAQSELTESYQKTENKYNKVYKNALKKLSKSDQNKVKNGSYTIEQFKGKAKSGTKSKAEKRYNNIQKALTARDNYLEASTSNENEKQKLAEYREALASVRWENATTKVEKLNNQLGVLDSRMTNVSGYAAKKKVLNQQLALQKDIITAQQNAYDQTQNDANAYYKKISSKYKKNKNADGTIKTTGIKDSKQLSYIKMYNAYIKKQAENYIELQQAIEDYTSARIEAYQTTAEEIKTEYDNKLSLIETKRTKLENRAALAEAKGQVVSASYYDKIAKNSTQRINSLKNEKEKLEEQMKGVRKYSDLWYTLTANVNDVDKAIDEETKNVVENINKQAEALMNLATARNEYLSSTSDTLDWLNNFVDEDDYFDDNGDYTNKGFAVMKNKLSQLEIERTKAENLEKALADLDANKDDMSEAKYLEERNKIIKDYQDIETNIANKEKEIADIRNKSLEKQADKLKDIIDLKKKSLDADKTEYDYQKSISEKTKNIADLEKQLAMLEGNNSEEAIAERQKLQKQLGEAQDDLKDTQYDKYIDRLEDAFSDLEDRFDKLIEQMEKEDAKITVDDVKDIVEGNNSSKAEEGNKEIINENNLKVFDETAKSLLSASTDTKTEVSKANEWLEKILSATVSGSATVKTSLSLDDVLGKASAENKKVDTSNKSSVNKYLASQGYETKGYQGMVDLTTAILQSKYADGMSRDDFVKLSEIVSEDQFDGKKDKNATANKNLLTKSLKYVKANEFIAENAVKGKKKRDEYSKANRHIFDKTDGKVLSVENLKKLAAILNVSYDSKKIYDALKACGYSEGGIVGKVIHANGDDGIATLKVGEAVLTPVQTDALVALSKNLVPLNNFMNVIKKPNITPRSNNNASTTSINGGVNFEFNLPNVVDSESLIKTIQNDTKLQRTLQNATVGKLNGNTHFGVNRL